MKILRLPSHITMLGFTLSCDGSQFYARNSDSEMIGTFLNHDDALDFLEGAAAAEAAELDAAATVETDPDWLTRMIDPHGILTL